MKVLRVVLVLLVSCVGACSIKGQVQGNLDVDGMKNLKSFKVVVENLTPEAEKIGITRDLVETRTVANLHRDFPWLKVPDVSSFGIVYVAVNVVEVAKLVYAISLEVEVWRPVIVIQQDGRHVAETLASVWSDGSLLTMTPSNSSPRLSESLAKRITNLAAAYNRTNPEKEKAPTPG